MLTDGVSPCPQGSQSLSTPQRPMLRVSMQVPPDWARIDHVRESVQMAVRAAYAPILVGDRIGIVVSELLENAIKYGQPGPILLEVEGASTMIRIAVTNRVSETGGKVEQLRPHIEWIESFEDPQQAYMACLTMAFQRPEDPNATGSGLGLARIRYEGGCSLSVTGAHPDSITVVADQTVDWDDPHAAD